MRISFLLVTILVTLSACNNKIKKKIGVMSTGPEEFMVQRNKTLEVPPHYELPSVTESNKS